MGRLDLVIDAHIGDDNVDMMAARKAKIRKYSDNPGIDAAIKSKPGVVEVRHCPLIITSREIWCHKSAEDLFGLGVLTRKDILLMSLQVIDDCPHCNTNKATFIRVISSANGLVN